jgi:hypothetical protein
MPISSVVDGLGPVTSGISTKVRHEHTARMLECDAVQEMRDDPSERVHTKILARM